MYIQARRLLAARAARCAQARQEVSGTGRCPAARVLDKNDRLGTGNIKAAAAAFAGKHVVNAHHVVARFLVSQAVLLICAARRSLLLRSFQPTNVILGSGATVWATVSRLFRFLLFVKKILFVHISLQCGVFSRQSSYLSFTQITQVTKTVNPCLVAIAPTKVERVAANDAYVSYC